MEEFVEIVTHSMFFNSSQADAFHVIQDVLGRTKLFSSIKEIKVDSETQNELTYTITSVVNGNEQSWTSTRKIVAQNEQVRTVNHAERAFGMYSSLETEYLFKEIDPNLTLVTACFYLGFDETTDADHTAKFTQAAKENMKYELGIYKNAAEQRSAELEV